MLSAGAVDDGSGHSQFHFGAGRELAPNIEMAADLFGALAHAGQTPVANAFAVNENVGIDTHTVIADSNAEKLFTVGNFLYGRTGYALALLVVFSISATFLARVVAKLWR